MHRNVNIAVTAFLLITSAASSLWGDAASLPVIQTGGQSYQVVNGVFTPNAIRRRGGDGSFQTHVTLLEGSNPLRRQTPLDAIMNGNPSDGVQWDFVEEEADQFQATLVFDLGDTLVPGRMTLHWLNDLWAPKTVRIRLSKDNETFTDATGPLPHARRVDLPGEPVRYIHVELTGANSPSHRRIALGEIQVFLSEAGPPPTDRDGYSLGLLPGVSYRITDQAWWHRASILNGSHRMRVHPNWKEDAPFIVDLHIERELTGVHLTFHPTRGSGWEHGARIEYALDQRGPWTTALETREPFQSSTVKLSDQPVRARFLRITNLAGEDSGPSGTNLVLLEPLGPVDPATQTPIIGHVAVPQGHRVSAGVYDAGGDLVRTLFDHQTGVDGRVTLRWDGYDEAGTPAGHGQYEWRAILTQSSTTTLGSVGDSGTPPFGENEALGGISTVAFDRQGHLYQGGWWMERHNELRKSTIHGETLWDAKLVGTIALAADEQQLFATLSPYNVGEERVYRLCAETGVFMPFPDGKEYLVVNTGLPKRAEPGMTRGERRHEWESLNAIALDSRSVWVSNYRENRIDLFDRESGERQGHVSVSRPVGIAVHERSDGSGWCWVAADGALHTFAFSPERSIAKRPDLIVKAGAHPVTVAVRWDGRQLVVGDREDGLLRFYQLDEAGQAVWERSAGGRAEPGLIISGRIRSQDRWGVALAPDGGWAVADGGNRSLWIHDNADHLIRHEFSEFQPAPFVYDITPESHRMVSGPWEYKVLMKDRVEDNPVWHGDGQWTLRANWAPEDRLYVQDKSIVRTLSNGRHYLFYLQTPIERGLAVYEIEDDIPRRSALLGTSWSGLDGTASRTMALWSWRDPTGAGKFDDTLPDEEQITFASTPGTNHGVETRAPGVWVDEAGDVWFARANRAVIKVPLQGFDEHHNPIYDFEQRQVVVPADLSPERYIPTNLKTHPNGDIYTLGFSQRTGGHPWLWMGGKEIRVYSPEGEIRRRFTIPRGETIASFDFDHINPDIIYTARNIGSDHEVRAWTADGLCLAVAVPDHQLVGNTGWVDHFMGLCAFSPDGVARMVYAEDVLHGKSILYRFDELHEIDRMQGRFVLE